MRRNPEISYNTIGPVRITGKIVIGEKLWVS